MWYMAEEEGEGVFQTEKLILQKMKQYLWELQLRKINEKRDNEVVIVMQVKMFVKLKLFTKCW